MIKNLKVSIVGGGIGGLAAAVALASRGAQVTVLEQADAIREVGAGLQISPNGLCVLRAMGLEHALAEHAPRGQAVSLRRAEDDAEVARLDLARLAADQRYYFVHRADLIEILLGAAQAHGVQLRLLQKVTSIVPGNPAQVHFATGAQLEADLVIDAGGLHSQLRGTLNGKAPPFFTGQVAWRALIPNTKRQNGEVHLHMAPRRHLVSYPLRGGSLLNLVAVQERQAWANEDWSHQDDPANLRRAFSDCGIAVRGLLDQVQEVHLWGLFRHPVAERWFGENCALLGDAAHPTLPFLAQGASMALEDAWGLALSLERASDLQAGLHAYQSLRRTRVKRVIDTASANAWRYHLPRGPMRFAAHSVLRAGSRLAPGAMTGHFDWLYGYDITQI